MDIMNKANFLKISIGILSFMSLLFSLSLFRNYQEGHGCMDCTIERTLTGEGYDGWQKSSNNCKEFIFNKESSRKCLNSNLPSSIEVQNITESEIKIPSLQIFNTVLSSKNSQAFIIEGEGCRPSFAIVSDGRMFSTGGCLG